MKRLSYLLFVALAVNGLGCATSRPPEGRHAFTFLFEGAEYHIIGADLASGDGANLLVLRDEGHVVLRAVDLDQDGVIDTVLTGNASVTRANEIYAFGIAAAKSQGRYSVQTPPRLFEFSHATGTFTIQTNLLGDGTARNRFAFESMRARDAFVALDANANGMLDKVQQGNVGLDEAQEAYEKVLGDGVRLGRIDRSNGQYIVTMDGRNLSFR